MALGTTSTPPAGGAASYNPEPRRGNSGIRPLDGIVRDQPRPPGQGPKNGRFGIDIPFYVGDAEFDGLARLSAQILKLLMERGPDWEYFTKPAKSLFILDTSGQDASARREFTAEGLALNLFSGSQCLGAYLGP